MSRMLFIRTDVFGVTQAGMASIAGVAQGTVSKWDTGRHHPSLEAMIRIRAEALRQKKPWDDRWMMPPPRAKATSAEAA